MRIVASVQSKRGSSRGLVHYIAHSKLDTERERGEGRELFNAFADSLSVKSANNSIKAGISRGRPSNDELHHLVLSFRMDDYRKLGKNESRRRHALKDVTRAAMKRLENELNAERLSWAAAVHLNTDNPHVHIAIQKQFFTKEMERRILARIPREALPHFEVGEGEKVFVTGALIEAATERMESVIARDLALSKDERQGQGQRETEGLSGPDSAGERGRENEAAAAGKLVNERDILRRGMLAESELDGIEKRIKLLLDHSDKMRFVVSDPESGRRRRLSLREIEQGGPGQNIDSQTAPERQIRAILHKMLAKEEAAKIQLHSDTADTMREADRIKKRYREDGRKLPVPSLTRSELDMLQERCLEVSNIRRFSYLERIRTELERSGEIEVRNRNDLGRIVAQKTISDLRSRLHEKNHAEFSDGRYYRLVDVGDRRVSLALLDRTVNAPEKPVLSMVEELKTKVARIAGKGPDTTVENETDLLRNEIVKRLDENLASIKKNQRIEQKKTRILDNILTAGAKISAVYSPEQLAELEMLSLRLKMRTVYQKNWEEQRSLVESAGRECPAHLRLLKANPASDFTERKNNVLAGRALAREIVARVEFDKAKEDLKTFKETKRFQRFAVADKKTGSVAFLSPHDVDPPSRGSLLDRAIDELLESREHRSIRRAVGGLVREREQRLKGEVAAAKGILASAVSSAAEFKQFSFFGLKSEVAHQPIFTSAEITAIEMRAIKTLDPKEAVRLREVIDAAADQPGRSLTEILRDFEKPEKPHPEIIKLDLRAANNAQPTVQDKNASERTTARSAMPGIKDHDLHDLSR